MIDTRCNSVSPRMAATHTFTDLGHNAFAGSLNAVHTHSAALLRVGVPLPGGVYPCIGSTSTIFRVSVAIAAIRRYGQECFLMLRRRYRILVQMSGSAEHDACAGDGIADRHGGQYRIQKELARCIMRHRCCCPS